MCSTKYFDKMKQTLIKNYMYYNYFNDPKKMVRFCVLFGCSIIVIYQVYEEFKKICFSFIYYVVFSFKFSNFLQLFECFSKLRQPPISTHSHFDFNETIYYPAITFCREPAYKYDVLEVEYRF